MKLVIVHDFANAELGAGATRCAIDTAIAMKAQGVEVEYLAAAGDPDPELLQANVTVTTLGQSDIRRNRSRVQAALTGLWNQDAANAVDEVIVRSDLRNTVFHVHTWSKALSPSVLLPLTKPGVNSIFHLHEYFTACPNGGFFHYPSLTICRRKPLGMACLTTQCDSRSAATKAWRVGRHLLMSARTRYPGGARNFILLSETQREVLGPYLPSGANTVLMRNPIAVEKEPRVPRESGMRFLFVGRVSKEKGLALLVQAFLERQEELVVIGDGPDLDWLKSALPRCEYRGWQTKSEVIEAMRHARGLIFPSLWYEGLPMVVLEALACGTPVVTSGCSSATEVVSHGETGLIFDETRSGALAQAVEALLDDERAEAISRGAYETYWSDPCDMARFSRETIALYERVLSAAAV